MSRGRSWILFRFKGRVLCGVLLVGLFTLQLVSAKFRAVGFPSCNYFSDDAPVLFVIPNRSSHHPRRQQRLSTSKVERKRSVASSISNDENSNENDQSEEYDLFDYFDPRLSPHLYPGGIPSPSTQFTTSSTTTTTTITTIIEKEVRSFPGNINRKIGILLIDHGSKRDSSNLHLESLAKAYKRSSRCPPHYIVQAAHMEIASPSIEDGLRSLIAQGACK